MTCASKGMNSTPCRGAAQYLVAREGSKNPFDEKWLRATLVTDQWSHVQDSQYNVLVQSASAVSLACTESAARSVRSASTIQSKCRHETIRGKVLNLTQPHVLTRRAKWAKKP